MTDLPQASARSPLATLPGLFDCRGAIDAFTIAHGADIPAGTLDALNVIKFGQVPPEWAVLGMEALWAARADLPSAGADLCAELAEVVQRAGHRFYGEAVEGSPRFGRAYAILHVLKAERGDIDADPTVAAPAPEMEYVFSIASTPPDGASTTSASQDAVGT